MRTLASVLGWRGLSIFSNPLKALLEKSDEVDTVANAGEVRAFLAMARTHLKTPLSPAQETALREVLGGNGTPGFIDRTESLAFAHMNRLVVGLQLVARVIDNTRIQQRSHSLCGPVTLMHDFAKREPLGYVRYVIGLAETRRGSLALPGGGNAKAVKVKKGSNLLTKSARRGQNNIGLFKAGILEADYIALASLRNSASVLPYRAALTSTLLEGATSVAVMKTWMRDMGYTNVHDHTLSTLWAPLAKTQDLRQKFYDHLAAARGKLMNGEVVMLMAAGKLTEHQLGRDIKEGFGATMMTYFGGHFMLCRDIKTDPQLGVSFALDSWGDSSEVGQQWLPWGKVTSWYRGYISGQP